MSDDRRDKIDISSTPDLAARPIAVIYQLDPEHRRTKRVRYFCSSHCRFQKGPYGDEVQYGSVTEDRPGPSASARASGAGARPARSSNR